MFAIQSTESIIVLMIESVCVCMIGKEEHNRKENTKTMKDRDIGCITLSVLSLEA